MGGYAARVLGEALQRPLLRLWRGRLMIGAAALLFGVLAYAFAPAQIAAGFAAAASGLALALLGAGLAVLALDRRSQGFAALLNEMLPSDPDRLALTDSDGRPLGLAQGGQSDGSDPAELLASWCADPAAVMVDLLDELRLAGHARRDFARGAFGMRLTVHPLGRAGAGAAAPLLWRFAWVERPGRRGLDALGLPVLTLGADGRPLAANAALLRQTDAPDPANGFATLPEASLNALLAQLEPREPGADLQSVVLPSGQPRLVLPVAGHDGLRDLVFLPPGGTDGITLRGPLPRDFEEIPVALVQLDGEGRIYGTNRAARALVGLVAGENRPFWEVVEGLGRPVSEWLEDARAGRALNRPEVLRARFAPSETFVQIILRRGLPGAPKGALIAVVSDATELKSLEARFVQSQKMQAIGQLVGGIAHDFNNLLTAISGHCDLLLVGCDPFDPDFDDLKQIHANSDRAAALVRQLLAFSRKQTLQPESLAVEELLENVVDLLIRLVGERMSLRLVHDPAVGAIRVDRRQLEQVVMNLVVNARDAMPMGGEIRIETERLRLPTERRIGRARVPPGDYALIRVVDSGIGIPLDLLGRIFEPFFTTKRPGEGTGLGLSTAYGIVKQMGGFIFVESEEGVGTRFTLYFATDTAARRPAPRAHETAPASHPSPHGYQPGPSHAHPGLHEPAQPLHGAPRSRAPRLIPAGLPTADHAAVEEAVKGIVLLVEDEAPVRAFAARALRMQGYQVLEAEDGEQALEVLENPALRVDIFVTDVIMPGLDGPTWVTRALAARPETPVVFISGYIEDALTEMLSRIPGATFLEKPFSLLGLTQTIDAQLSDPPRR